MKRIGKLLLGLTCYCLVSLQCEATVYHSNGSAGSVQGFANIANNGDVITIPAGTFTWSTQVTISKGITLRGAGTGVSIIRDAIQGGSLLTWRLVANQNSRMTGIEFRDGGRVNSCALGVIMTEGLAYDQRTMRIDHCKFDHLNGLAVSFRDVIGVADHNTFLERGKEAIQVHHPGWGGGIFGNGSWTDSNHFGTSQFLFIEDNAFTYDGMPYGAIDAYQGARYVARHNVFTRCWQGGHGTEFFSWRGVRAVESYENTFIGGGSDGTLVNVHGGTALVHDNTATGGAAGVTRRFSLRCYRVFSDQPGAWAGATGRNPWDLNLSGGPFYSGRATSGTSRTVRVAGAGWTGNRWAGYSIEKTSARPPGAPYLASFELIHQTP